MVVYKRIRDLREDKDLTQRELANYLNVSQKSYSRYERGERTITPEMLSKIATYHETSVDYLLERTDDKTAYSKKSNQSKR
ncbi:helix-turn-helix domain-containing protein [Thomasclavelia sp.]